jgi:hypothetical protein
MSGLGRGATGVLKVDGKDVATETMEHTIPFILQWDETFDVGADTGTPVDDADSTPNLAFRRTEYSTAVAEAVRAKLLDLP